jgi:single-strand DNA-binding protein
MNNYEGLFILKPDLKEEDAKNLTKAIAETITKNGGSIKKEENWGKKQLAYAVKKFKDGLYYKVDFDIKPDSILKIESVYKLNLDILRAMITRKWHTAHQEIAMASLNKVLLIGNLTRDPELRYVPSGTAVATFTLAVNRFYTSQAGEKKEETSFIRIVVWGRRAEVCGEYLSKGSPVFVEGRLQSRNWEAQDGQKRSTIEVIADNIQFLRSAGDKGQQESAGKGSAQQAPEEIDSINLNEDIGPAADNNSAKGNGKDNKTEEVPF